MKITPIAAFGVCLGVIALGLLATFTSPMQYLVNDIAATLIVAALCGGMVLFVGWAISEIER
jgi:hypothetical protein